MGIHSQIWVPRVSEVSLRCCWLAAGLALMDCLYKICNEGSIRACPVAYVPRLETDLTVAKACMWL